ncbi:MAG: biotin transporter BioY [Syntrophomonadaceae bacterium]|nr:biotin transporter BioY [Syntrophomonadaceae bacterium]
MTSRELAMAGVMAALACCAAVVFRWVQPALVPFSVLPVVALVTGGLLRPRAAAASMGGYALIGLAGVPVFASPPFGGAVYIFKPTFGFILGYVAAAWTVAQVRRRLGLTPLRAAVATLAGVAALYAVGLPYLYLVLRVYAGQTLDLARLLEIGFWPFIALDALKALVAAALVVQVAPRLGAGE